LTFHIEKNILNRLPIYPNGFLLKRILKLETNNYQEKTILVGLVTPQQNREKAKEYIEELAFLAKTAGAVPEKIFLQQLDHPNPETFVGPGKLEQIKNYLADHPVDMAVFDDELSARQIRNLESELKIKILDRTNLILDIFAKRAKTASAKTQVELAQYQYLLPRLTRMWTHLERQQGGIGTRGPGETQIETDRRIILSKIAQLKQNLKEIDRQMSTQRKNRGKLVRVALVGYTNVGKSTLMNLLSKSNIFAEDKLFATLDTTVRKVIIDNLPFLLTDTVGFIRKLPHHLIESFKSTLDEVREADLLIHVVDVSHPNFEEQIQVVNQTLKEITNEEKPMILVFNKIDAYNHKAKDPDDLTPKKPENISLEEIQKTWMAKIHEDCVFISATKKQNIEELKKIMYQKIKAIHVQRYPYNDFLYQDFEMEENETDEVE